MPRTPGVPCLRPEGELMFRPGNLRGICGTGGKQLRSVCPWECRRKRNKEAEGDFFPFLSSSLHVPGLIQPSPQSPATTKWPHLSLPAVGSPRGEDDSIKIGGSVLWQTLPFQMAFVRQFLCTWLCAWHFGKKLKT